jgi:hypothetical protein
MGRLAEIEARLRAVHGRLTWTDIAVLLEIVKVQQDALTHVVIANNLAVERKGLRWLIDYFKETASAALSRVAEILGEK